MATVRAISPAISAQAVHGGLKQLEQLAPEWQELWTRSRNPEPFYRPEWPIAYLRAFQPQASVLLLQARVDGRLCAVLPLVERVRSYAGVKFRTLDGAANVHSCRFDLLCAPGSSGTAAIEAIWQALRQLTSWDAITIPAVPAGGAAEELLQLATGDGFTTARWPGDRSPYIPLDQAAANDPAKLAANHHFRSNLKRRARKAAALGELRLRKIEAFDPTALHAFFELEERGWKGRRATAIACSQQTASFYTEIAREAARHGYLAMYFLELAGRPLAAHFGLNCGSRYYTPKVAYDETRAVLGPGHLLIERVLREACASGLTEFDFLGPNMPWKAQWTRKLRPHWSLYIYRPGVKGRAMHFVRFVLMAAARKALNSRTAAKIDA